jgi:hypothetical protein
MAIRLLWFWLVILLALLIRHGSKINTDDNDGMVES